MGCGFRARLMDVPMDEDSAAGAEAFFDECIGVFELFKQVLVFDVVDFDLQVLVVVPDIILFDVMSQDREDVGDVGSPHGLLAAQCEETGPVSYLLQR
jgi:hypothetical protein